MANVYVDPSATYNGDGTDAAQATEDAGVGAFNNLESYTPTLGDFVWVRKVSTVNTLTANYSITVVMFLIGWPAEGDVGYDSRPASGTSAGWDSDTEEYANFESTTYYFYVYAAAFIANIKLNRTGESNNYAFYLGQEGASVQNCVSLSNDTWEGNSGSMGLRAQNFGCMIQNMIIKGFVDSTSTDCMVYAYGSYCFLSDIFIECGEVYDASDGKVVYVQGDYNIIKNLQITMLNYYIGDAILFITGNYNEIDMSISRSDAWSSESGNGSVEISGDGNKISIEYTGYCYNFLVTGNCNEIEITGMPWYLYNAINITGYKNIVKVKNVQYTGVSTVFTISGHENIVIGEDVVIVDSATMYSISQMDSNLMLTNYDGTEGLWFCGSANLEAYSSSVVRTGGESFSIRYELTSDNAGYIPMFFGREDGEVLWASLSAGTVTIEMFFATKLLSLSMEFCEFAVSCQYVDSNGRTKTACSSSKDIVTDTSTWTGDTDLSLFKTSLTFAVPSDQVASIRIRARWPYGEGAYLYLDPKPVISYS